jgi:hypothetical protein
VVAIISNNCDVIKMLRFVVVVVVVNDDDNDDEEEEESHGESPSLKS